MCTTDNTDYAICTTDKSDYAMCTPDSTDYAMCTTDNTDYTVRSTDNTDYAMYTSDYTDYARTRRERGRFSGHSEPYLVGCCKAVLCLDLAYCGLNDTMILYSSVSA